MKKQYDEEKKIAVFPNAKKTSNRSPDWMGKLQIDGVKYKLALWDRKSLSGYEFMSGEVEEMIPITADAVMPPDKEEVKPKAPPPARALRVEDDDVPF
jgi:hypothetical protein